MILFTAALLRLIASSNVLALLGVPRLGLSDQPQSCAGYCCVPATDLVGIGAYDKQP
jgi:hypothetical protein